jgi:hypothetical protein
MLAGMETVSFWSLDIIFSSDALAMTLVARSKRSAALWARIGCQSSAIEVRFQTLRPCCKGLYGNAFFDMCREQSLIRYSRWYPALPLCQSTCDAAKCRCVLIGVFLLGIPHRVMQDDVYKEVFIPKGSIIVANTLHVPRS